MSKKESKRASSRSAMQQYAEKYFEMPFSELNDSQRHEGLLRFYISEIFNPTKSSLDEDEIEEGIVDSAGDAGADFIHRDNNQVVIIQTKYRAPTKREDAKEIAHFQKVLRRLHPTLGKGFKKSERLMEISREIDFDKDVFFLFYITMGKVVGNAKTQAKEPIEDIKGIQDIPERTTFEVIDEQQLNSEYRLALSLDEGLPEEV